MNRSMKGVKILAIAVLSIGILCGAGSLGWCQDPDPEEGSPSSSCCITDEPCWSSNDGANAEDCATRGGTWREGISCKKGDPCNPGACCLNPPGWLMDLLEDGPEAAPSVEEIKKSWNSCEVRDKFECGPGLLVDGTFNGIGTQCEDPGVCPTGACCNEDIETAAPAIAEGDPPEGLDPCSIFQFLIGGFGECKELPLQWCALLDGVSDKLCPSMEGFDYKGNYSSCETEGVCTEQLGACCPGIGINGNRGTTASVSLDKAVNGGCRYTTEEECDALFSGIWNPDQTCDEYEVICSPEEGQCIASDGLCEETPRILCDGEWSPGRCPENVPTLNQWGLIAFGLLMMTAALIRLTRRKG